jgi:hypothetical protein
MPQYYFYNCTRRCPIEYLFRLAIFMTREGQECEASMVTEYGHHWPKNVVDDKIDR